MVHIVKIKLLKIYLLALFSYIDTCWDIFYYTLIILSINCILSFNFLLSRADALQLFLFVLFGLTNVAHLVPHILCALFFKSLHERLVNLKL